MQASRFVASLSRWGILPRTAFTIGWMAVLVGAVSMVITVMVTRDRTELHALRELSELLDTVESTVQIACFVGDHTLAEEVVRGMLKNRGVLGVTISASGRELGRGFKASAGASDSVRVLDWLTHGSAAIDARLTRLVVSPFDSAETVGEIVLVADKGAIAQRIADDVRFVGVLLGVQWLVIGGGLLMLVLSSVVCPIKIISDQLHRMDPAGGGRLRAPAGHENTEIGRLVADINGLASRLVGALEQATERSRQLQDAKEQVDAQALQLQAKNAALGRAMQVQEEVERIARHDLKTPLSSIAAIPALLREMRPPGPDEDALLAMIETSAKRVLRMVSLSLDLFRMERGDYDFRPRAVELVALARVAIRDLALEAGARRVACKVDAGAARVIADADEVLCYSILANLIRNAVEAAPEGTRVRVSIRPGDPVRVEIHNHGAVPLPVRASFFDKYATCGKSNGTGLGTYSARLMARVQRGDLTMETSENDGTTLKLELPWRWAGGCEEGAMEAPRRGVLPRSAECPRVPPLRILLVDDDPMNLIVVKMMLPSPPLDVATAINGREAVEACRAQRRDVVFMDLEMPVMGGVEALKRIRTLQAERGETPSMIVAFSAHDDEASRQRSLAVGFDLHLSKPSSRGEILALLGRTGAGAAAGESEIEGKPMPKALSETVVWVDDDLVDAIPEFLESRRKLTAQLRRAFESGERESLRRLAHKLRGGFSLYGFAWAARICRELEDRHPCAGAKLVALQIEALEQHLAHVDVRARTPLGTVLPVDNEAAAAGSPRQSQGPG